MKDQTYIKVYCVVEKDGMVMMTQDIEGQPGWKFPGGHVEQGELLLPAGVREVNEETGYTVKPTTLLLIEDFFNRKRKEEHNLRIFLITSVTGGEEKMREGEVKALRWFSHEELLGLREGDIYPPHWAALKKYLSGTSYPIESITEVNE